MMGPSLLWFGAAMLLLMGVPLLALGLVFRGRNAGFNRRAVSTEGRVVGARKHRMTSTSIPRWVYFPTVRYTTDDGVELEASAPGEREPPAEGTRVPLLYDPADPEQVSFTGPRGAAGVARALAGLGCVLVLGGLATAAAGAVAFFL